MKRRIVDNIDLDRVVDIMYEPKKIKLDFNGYVICEDRYSVLVKNGTRKTIKAETFFNLIELNSGGMK